MLVGNKIDLPDRDVTKVASCSYTLSLFDLPPPLFIFLLFHLMSSRHLGADLAA